YRIVLLTGSLEQDRQRDVRRHIAQGNAQLVSGTHALIQDRVEFENLGLVVVDEQHRFGVMQRLKLMRKTEDAHVVTGLRPVLPGTDVGQDGAKPRHHTNSKSDSEPDVLVMTAT